MFRKMSVEDNILSVLEMTGKPRDYQLNKLEELIKEFRLGKVRKNKGDQLSGGERRRTEIARCLAIEPKFIMLDEPFAGVDPIAVEDIQFIVWKLKDRNIGILITDHRTRSCVRNTSPTRSCSVKRTSNCLKRNVKPKKKLKANLLETNVNNMNNSVHELI